LLSGICYNAYDIALHADAGYLYEEETIMKKVVSILLVLSVVFGLCSFATAEATKYRVAMITDYGDITDQSFNQTTYEACKAFCEANTLDFKYYKPSGDSTAERVAMVDAAVADGYNVIVMPGYAFAGTIVAAAPEYPDVKFIVLDVAVGDVLSAKFGDKYTWNPNDYKPEDSQFANVVSCVYQEELCGYMAGYAAVKMGYTHLGFLGGMAVPAVIRYGFGYVQGANAAAVELGIADKVTLEYVYGNQFFGDADITAYTDNWYQNLGVQVVFACGGGIYTSAGEAAAKVKGGKLIGVDVDQSFNLDAAYGAGITLTSAMKGLAATTKTMLTETILNNNWAAIGGKYETLGLVSANPDDNYVGLPATTLWSDTFTKEDYAKIVADMFAGTLKVSNAVDAMPATEIKVNDLGTVK
jgi:basic membrane protein A